jgi:hypothetical protein
MRFVWALLLLASWPVCAPGLAAEPQAGRRQIVFMIGEPEYRTEETLPEFFQNELAAEGYRAVWIVAPRTEPDSHDFAGLEQALNRSR